MDLRNPTGHRDFYFICCETKVVLEPMPVTNMATASVLPCPITADVDPGFFVFLFLGAGAREVS